MALEGFNALYDLLEGLLAIKCNRANGLGIKLEDRTQDDKGRINIEALVINDQDFAIEVRVVTRLISVMYFTLHLTEKASVL